MVTSIQIERLRGIREGRLDDLTPLVILVGPNGCGKSTVLDALLIGCHPVPGEGLSIAAARHTGTQQPATWLLWRGGSALPAMVQVALDDGTQLVRIERLQQRGDAEELSGQATKDGKGGSFAAHFMSGRSRSHGEWRWPGSDGRAVQLVDPRRPDRPDPAVLWTAMIKQGRRDEAREALRTLLPEAVTGETLSEPNKTVLYVDYGTHAVPAAVSGDGVYGMLTMSLELAAVAAGGLVLLEEPELHLHPAAIWQAAKVIWAAVRRGVQVVLSTHSLELIDALLAEAEADLEKLSCYLLRLQDGQLIHSRLPGEGVRTLRQSIDEDLR